MAKLVDIQACARHIESLQQADGSIPWIEAGIWDAWNHGEAVMGLAIAGRRSATLKALDCLVERQAADGSWLGSCSAGTASGSRLGSGCDDSRKCLCHRSCSAAAPCLTEWGPAATNRS